MALSTLFFKGHTVIELQNKTTRYTVQEANAQAYRAIIDSGKPVSVKMKVEAKHSATRRDYPVFKAGMTTGDYVSQYAALNSRLLLKGEGYTHADRVAPTLDPSQPEALEELDPDYVPTVSKPKQTLATTRAAIHRALCALALGDAEKAEKILREVI